jgi:DNA-binding transcriptional regulator LsrR (DeoR family)
MSWAGTTSPPCRGRCSSANIGGHRPTSGLVSNQRDRSADRQQHRRPCQLSFAQVLPGPQLYELLVRDESIQRVLHLWPYAQCAITSVGAPPLLREQLPQFLAPAIPSLMEAVGDISSRFFDRLGEPVDFPGSDRLIAVELSMLQRIPAVIAVAAGTERIAPLLAGARKKYFNQLVTDPATAEQLLAASLAFDGHPRDRDGAAS